MTPDQPVQNHMTTIFTERLIILFTLIFLAISLLNNQNQMTILILIVSGMVFFTKIWSRFAFSKMIFEIKTDKTRIFPHESITFEIAAENNKILPVWMQVKIMIDDFHFVSDKPTLENSFLLWFQKTKFTWDLKALKRGCFSIGNPNITTADLFSFFPRQKTQQKTIDVIVYPKIIPIKPFSIPEHIFFGIPGAKSPVKDPIYILGTREYQSFTPVKLIHWKASARYARLQEKVCEPSVQKKILIVIDVSLFQTHKAKKDFENMLEAVASMAVNFEAKGNAVGFMTNAIIKGGKSGFVPLSRNRKDLSKILETIARMEMAPDSKLSNIFHKHINVLWGINCVFCSYSIDSSIVKMQQYYAIKRIPVKYFVSSIDNTENDTAFDSGAVQQIDSICIKKEL